MNFQEFLKDHPKVRMFIEQNHNMLPYLVYLARGGECTAESFYRDLAAHHYRVRRNPRSQATAHLSPDEIKTLYQSDYVADYNPAFLHYPVSLDGPCLIFSLDRALIEGDWQQVLDAMCEDNKQQYCVGLTIYSWLYPNTSVSWFVKKYNRFHSEYCAWTLENHDLLQSVSANASSFTRYSHIRDLHYNVACQEISGAMRLSKRQTKMLYAAYEMVRRP